MDEDRVLAYIEAVLHERRVASELDGLVERRLYEALELIGRLRTESAPAEPRHIEQGSPYALLGDRRKARQANRAEPHAVTRS